jgi:hypothetical protein
LPSFKLKTNLEKLMSDDKMTNEQQREVKNAIFSARQAAEQAGLVSRAEAARQELGIEIPSALVPLPSRGLVYPTDSPLYGRSEIEIKGMTTQEEDILMSRALIKKGTVITELIRSCLMDPGIQVNDLLSGDRNALMVAVRITGYGPEYSAQVQCPACEARQEFAIDLSNLEIKPLEIEPSATGVNQFSFTLPISKKEVLFRFLTGKEEEEIMATMENKKKKGLVNDNVVTTRLFYSILSVDGKTDKTIISKYIQFMAARDSLALRQYIDKHEPGIDMRHPFECKSCGHSEVIAVPMGPSFFWPNTGG